MFLRASDGRKRSVAGETLAETMFSMLIISMGMLMLSGAVFRAARINERTERALNPAVNPEERVLSSDSDSYLQFVPLRDGDGAFEVKINVIRYYGEFFYERYDETAE